MFIHRIVLRIKRARGSTIKIRSLIKTGQIIIRLSHLAQRFMALSSGARYNLSKANFAELSEPVVICIRAANVCEWVILQFLDPIIDAERGKLFWANYKMIMPLQYSAAAAPARSIQARRFQLR